MIRLLKLTGLLLFLAVECSCLESQRVPDYKTAYSLPDDWAARCAVNTDTAAPKYKFMAVTTDWIKEQVRKKK